MSPALARVDDGGAETCHRQDVRRKPQTVPIATIVGDEKKNSSNKTHQYRRDLRDDERDDLRARTLRDDVVQQRPLSAEPLLERLGTRPVHEPYDVERRAEGDDERQGADVAYSGLCRGRKMDESREWKGRVS